VTDIIQPEYMGDRNMLLDLAQVEQLKHSTRIQKRLIGREGAGLRYLGLLLLTSRKELMRLPYIGKTVLDEIEDFLEQLSEKTGRVYKLKPNADFDGSAITITGDHRHVDDYVKHKYSLLSDHTILSEPIIYGNATSADMKGFAASDFEIVAASAENGHVVYDVRFKDEKLRLQWQNLVKDGYIQFRTLNEDTPQQSVFRERMRANCVLLTEEDDGVMAYYDHGSDSLIALASGNNILKGFAEAVNEILPAAQEAAVKGAPNRYGLLARPA